LVLGTRSHDLRFGTEFAPPAAVLRSLHTVSRHSPNSKNDNSPHPMVLRNTIAQWLTTLRLRSLLLHDREDSQCTHQPVHRGSNPVARSLLGPWRGAATRVASCYGTHVLQSPRYLRGRRAGHSLRRFRARIAPRTGGRSFSRTLCAWPCHSPAPGQTMLRSPRSGGARAVAVGRTLLRSSEKQLRAFLCVGAA